MARATIDVIQALRTTAFNLAKATDYQWGHMGSCNCGYLAQAITKLTKREIHATAMKSYGDWSEQLNDYCPSSGLPMDGIISQMLESGFEREDLTHLERLSDPTVLQRLTGERRYLRHNSREDVILYLQTWAAVLESHLLENLQLPELMEDKEIIKEA